MQLKTFFAKNKIAIILLLIISEALFVRLYHHRDWLHFQLDQSRDSFLIQEAYKNGPGDLPLLGPRAGGSFLRLGPFYYYLLYLAVLIANSTDPAVFAWPDLLAGILLVPVLYLLLRRILDWRWSLVVTFLAVNSTFLITYDRFSWNPNMMPFFTALTFFAWLKYWEEKRKGNEKSSFRWAIALGAITGLFSQLHFVSFVSLPLILGITFGVFWARTKFGEKASEVKPRSFAKDILVFATVFLLLQTPIFLNEYLSQGANTTQFFETISKKEGKDRVHTTAEKIVENLWVYPKGFWISSTGNLSIDYPVWKLKPNFDIKCDNFCKQNLSTTILASFFFAIPISVFLVILYQKTRRVLLQRKKEKKQNSRLVAKWEILFLTFVWIMIPWWSFYSLSFTLRPRFFLFSAVPFWIVLGVFLASLAKQSTGKLIAALIAIIILSSNVFQTYKRFETLSSAAKEVRKSYTKDLMLFQDENFPVTLEEQEGIANWIRNKFESEGQKEGKDKLFFWAQSFYYRPIIYLLDKDKLKNNVFYFSGYPVWRTGDYYAAVQTGDFNDFFNNPKRAGAFTVVDSQAFGTLTVYRLTLTPEGLEEATRREKKFKSGKEFSQREKRECLIKPKATCRFVWKDILP